MDNIINLAKQGYQAYESSQGGGHNQSDNVQDQRHHEAPGVPQFDHNEVVDQASQHAGEHGNSSLFTSALSHITGHPASAHTQPIDEAHVMDAHRQAYEHNQAGSLDAGSMGAAAAMQALKMFTSGSSKGSGGSTQLVSLAMGEASKLFESSGGASSGVKQDVINGAAMTMMKMVVQSKISGGLIGGGNSGGLGSIMGMANKFL